MRMFRVIRRRQINRRLNSTLAYTNVASGIEQLSGQLIEVAFLVAPTV